MFYSYILSVASYLPDRVLNNEYFENSLDTSDEWITQRTGIKSRHVISDVETTSSLAINVARDAINKTALQSGDIDVVIVATSTPENNFPGCGNLVQKALVLKNAFVFDMQVACSGFLFALSVADNFIRVGKAKNVLVIGVDVMSKIVDYSDRNTCILFGDGAGAVILQQTVKKNFGIIDYALKSDGSMSGILYTSGGLSSNTEKTFVRMNGTAVYNCAIISMKSVILEICKKNDKLIDEIDVFVIHQANVRIINALAKQLCVSQDRFIKTVDIHANTSAASIPLALDYAYSNGYIIENNNIIFASVGAGMSWGAILVRT